MNLLKLITVKSKVVLEVLVPCLGQVVIAMGSNLNLIRFSQFKDIVVSGNYYDHCRELQKSL